MSQKGPKEVSISFVTLLYSSYIFCYQAIDGKKLGDIREYPIPYHFLCVGFNIFINDPAILLFCLLDDIIL